MPENELIEIAILKTRMDEMEKNINKRFDNLEETIKLFIDNSERKFSAKWVEDAVKYVTVTIVGIVIVAILKLVVFTNNLPK